MPRPGRHRLQQGRSCTAMWPTPARGRAPGGRRCRGRAAPGYSRDGRARQCGRHRPGVEPCVHSPGPAATGYSRDGRARQCGRPRPGVEPCVQEMPRSGRPRLQQGRSCTAMWPTPARGRALRAGDAEVGPPPATAGAATHAMWPTPARGRALRAFARAGRHPNPASLSTQRVNRPTLFSGHALASRCVLHVSRTHEDRTLPRDHLHSASRAMAARAIRPRRILNTILLRHLQIHNRPVPHKRGFSCT
jgi:hypothetical protein